MFFARYIQKNGASLGNDTVQIISDHDSTKYRVIAEFHPLHPDYVKTAGLSVFINHLCSYLNECRKAETTQRDLLRRLLYASLSGKELNKVSNEVAVALNFPDLQGYIKEAFQSPVVVREKKEIIEECNTQVDQGLNTSEIAKD